MGKERAERQEGDVLAVTRQVTAESRQVRAESRRKNIFSSASISSNGYLDQTFGLQTLQITHSDCLSLGAI